MFLTVQRVERTTSAINKGKVDQMNKIYSIRMVFNNTVIGMGESKLFRFEKESEAHDFMERAVASPDVQLLEVPMKVDLNVYNNVDAAFADLVAATKRGLK